MRHSQRRSQAPSATPSAFACFRASTPRLLAPSRPAAEARAAHERGTVALGDGVLLVRIQPDTHCHLSAYAWLHPWRPPALLQEGALGPEPVSRLLHEPPGPPWPSLREHARPRATSGGSSGESWEIIYAFCDCFPLAPYPSRLCQLWQTSARPYWDTMKADGTIASRAISASDLSKSDGPIMLQL